MFNDLASPDEWWCFPENPPRRAPGDRTERWCFPEGPPRVCVPGQDEPWCVLQGPPWPRCPQVPRVRRIFR